MQQQLEISNWLDTLRKSRVIAVIRTQEVAVGLALANAIAAGGGRLIEVAWNSNQPAQLIETLRDALPHCVIGCGTVLNQADLQDAIAAGAQFGFMPHVEPDLIRY
ncbi:MAG TPA: ketohydroxyglutarate aldolase, partial [Stenomitos sp.]